MSRMTDIAQKEVLRADVLEILEQSAPYGADARVIGAALKKSGYNVPMDEIVKITGYLEDKGLLKKTIVENKRLGIKREICRITPEGTDYLEGNGREQPGIEG